jgi:hypothetical protein
MGCDIHAYVEVKRNGRWNCEGDAFDCRNYGLFGFLAGVRNYSMVPVLAAPRGLPADVGDVVHQKSKRWGDDGHTHSWLSLRELADFDYAQQFEDRRVTRQTGPRSFNGGCTADPGGGTMTTYRELLGDWYFKELDRLRSFGEPGDVRVVFWFDN